MLTEGAFNCLRFGFAKEARALAEQMGDPEAKRTMLKNADDYERLAKRAEERAAGRWPQSK